jgi:pentatricopeptide repeat protein
MAALAPGTVQLDSFTWNKRIARSAKAGEYEKTMELLKQMQSEDMNPNKFTFVPILNACASLQALEEAKCVHKQIIQCGCESDAFVGTSLVDMYAKCGIMEDALRVFKKMPSHDVVSWAALLLGHVKCGLGQKALQLFQQMKREGMRPNPVTFVGVLNACASSGALEEGRCVHKQIVESGCESDVFVSSSLVDMYPKCGSMDDAARVFNKMTSRDVVSWSAMLSGL